MSKECHGYADMNPNRTKKEINEEDTLDTTVYSRKRALLPRKTVDGVWVCFPQTYWINCVGTCLSSEEFLIQKLKGNYSAELRRPITEHKRKRR